MDQHIDRLSKVISNVAEVNNLMKHVPTIETKNRNLDQLGKDLQKRMDGLDSRVSNMEKTFKKLTAQNYIILKAVADNFNTLLNKME